MGRQDNAISQMSKEGRTERDMKCEQVSDDIKYLSRVNLKVSCGLQNSFSSMEQVLPDQKGLGNKMEGKRHKDDHLSKKIDYKRKQRWNDTTRSGIQEIFWER